MEGVRYLSFSATVLLVDLTDIENFIIIIIVVVIIIIIIIIVL